MIKIKKGDGKPKETEKRKKRINALKLKRSKTAKKTAKAMSKV
jgi:hypothetical protein